MTGSRRRTTVRPDLCEVGLEALIVLPPLAHIVVLSSDESAVIVVPALLTRLVTPQVTQATAFHQGRPATRWRLVSAGGALCLLLLGLYLRLDGFSRSLWLDEFGTFWAVEADLITTLRRVWEFHGQSPFYYLLAWIPVHLVGESEVALRAPSLLFGCACVGLLYLSARTIGVPHAGVLAAVFAWCSGSFVRASAEARPYGLVLLTVAAAILAFQHAVLTGSRKARLLWVLAGAAVAWTHYVQYLVVTGLLLAYALFPDLRRRYRARWFVTDTVWQLGLVALCLPQALALFHRRQTLSFLDHANHLASVLVLLPFAVAIILAEAGGSKGGPWPAAVFRRTLWVTIITPVILLEAAALGGVNLLHPRYLQALVIPGVLLAAAPVPRLRPIMVCAGLLWFSVTSAAGFIQTRKLTGTYSGMGYEDWRGAVDALSTRLGRTPDAPVLYRSGFVEEDGLPLGSPPETTLAPLRSPGHERVRWKVRSLSFRWNNPARERYFEDDLGPALDQSRVFYFLGGASGFEPELYSDRFVAWVQRRWPNRFTVARTRFGWVELLTFEIPPPSHPPPEPR